MFLIDIDAIFKISEKHVRRILGNFRPASVPSCSKLISNTLICPKTRCFEMEFVCSLNYLECLGVSKEK